MKATLDDLINDLKEIDDKSNGPIIPYQLHAYFRHLTRHFARGWLVNFLIKYRDERQPD